MSWFLEVIRKSFSADGFVPRRLCGLWPDWLVWEHVGGNALIWLAYIALPLMIWRLRTRWPDWTPFRGLVLSFAMFIGLCGLGHFLEMLAFFSPMYRLSGHVLVATGLVSCWTVWSIRRAWPALLAMKSPDDLKRMITERTEELTLAVANFKRLEVDHAYLATIVDSSNDAIVGKDLNGRINYWNKGAEHLFGYNAAEAIGQSITFLLPADRLDEELTILEQLRHGAKVVHFESVRITKDGRLIDVSMTISPIKDLTGQVIGISKIARDITERNHAIRRLRDSDARTRAILDAAADAILTINERGLIESLNAAAERLFGYPAADLIGQNIKMLMPEPYQLQHDGFLANYRTTGEKKIIGIGREVVGLRQDGTTFPMHLAVSELSLGGRRMFTGIARDLTEREKSEELLRAARDEAMAASRTKSEFLANMSHEIRTPMNGVLGMTMLLLDTQLNDLQRNYTETVHSSGQALLTVINDILDFSKIEAGKLTLELVDFDLRELMEEVGDLLAPRVRQKSLELKCRVAREVPRRLIGDPVRIRQILTNLAGNAVKFTDRGEIALEAHLLSDNEEGVKLRILVRDTGSGIPADRHKDIFESFTQIEGGNSRLHGGTGLGLTICQSLVNLMGGRIGLESRSGQGSTFWFEATFGKGTSQDNVPANELNGLRVLIVDDKPADRESLRDVLLSWECRPEVVGSGVEALARLIADSDDDPFRIILLEREMTELDGEQTARVIKAMPRYAKVPIVLLGSISQPGAEEAENGLWAAQISKPVRRSLLYNTLCRTVSVPELLPHPPSAVDAKVMKLTSHLRILLAEDNEVNRQVAIGMVERLGCQVEAVWNGREALEALDYSQHDLILTDVQMPEMDGLTATAAIRELERGTGRHIPIIAMTAHAMQGDRERCLAAGMDGYVSKPIRPGPLLEALLACTAKIEPSPNPTESQHDPELATFRADRLQESCGNDPKLIRKVLELMLKGVPIRLERLEAAINTGDETQRSREAHSLKGAFATVGAEALALACQELMSLGKGKDGATIENVYRPIRNQWETLENEAKDYLETLPLVEV